MSISEPGSSLLVSVASGVAELRFSRQGALNVLDLATAEAFRSAIVDVTARPDVRVVLFSAEGRSFLAGGDLDHFLSAKDKGLAARRLIKPMHDGLLALAASGIPSIAAVQGAVAGAGVSLALMTDLAIAARSSRFVMAYINIAASPDCGGSWSLARLVGQRKAAEIALLSEPVDAAEALRLGLVNWVVPDDQLRVTAHGIAARIAAKSPPAARATKSLLARAPCQSLEAHLGAELETFARIAQSAHFEEALNAFAEKRKPNFDAKSASGPSDA